NALFTQYRGSSNRYDWQLAFRHDNNSQFGTANTGNIALGLKLSTGLQLTAAYGTAFKAPSFNQLYWPSHPLFGGGNPNLQPEKSSSMEINLRGYDKDIRWSIALFETQIDNLIDNWPPTNINKARIRGLEGELIFNLANNWQLQANATWQEPKARSGINNNNNKRLRRRARSIINLNLDHDFGIWKLGATIHGEEKRYDDSANADLLADFVTLDLRAVYSLDQAWRLEAKVSNSLDVDYETAAGYRQPGTQFFMTMRYAP
ncbi:hypothetical protein TI03_05845, partial [Achromatium sp. WMS1]